MIVQWRCRVATPLSLSVLLSVTVMVVIAGCTPSSSEAQRPSKCGSPGAVVPTPKPKVGEVLVYFRCTNTPLDSKPEPMVRPAPTAKETEPRLRVALEAQLAGPTPDEQARGLTSGFSEDTAGMLNSVTITPEGTAIVDFKDFSRVTPNSSTSTGMYMLFSELNSTIFQFEDIKAIEYRFDGRCEPFWSWLQMDCHLVTR